MISGFLGASNSEACPKTKWPKNDRNRPRRGDELSSMGDNLEFDSPILVRKARIGPHRLRQIYGTLAPPDQIPPIRFIPSLQPVL